MGIFITVNSDDFLRMFYLEISLIRNTGNLFDFCKLSAVFRAKYQAAYAVLTTILLFSSIDSLDLGVVFD